MKKLIKKKESRFDAVDAFKGNGSCTCSTCYCAPTSGNKVTIQHNPSYSMFAMGGS